MQKIVSTLAVLALFGSAPIAQARERQAIREVSGVAPTNGLAAAKPSDGKSLAAHKRHSKTKKHSKKKTNAAATPSSDAGQGK